MYLLFVMVIESRCGRRKGDTADQTSDDFRSVNLRVAKIHRAIMEGVEKQREVGGRL